MNRDEQQLKDIIYENINGKENDKEYILTYEEDKTQHSIEDETCKKGEEMYMMKIKHNMIKKN